MDGNQEGSDMSDQAERLASLYRAAKEQAERCKELRSEADEACELQGRIEQELMRELAAFSGDDSQPFGGPNDPLSGIGITRIF